jgi:hypothetical protein
MPPMMFPDHEFELYTVTVKLFQTSIEFLNEGQIAVTISTGGIGPSNEARSQAFASNRSPCGSME